MKLFLILLLLVFIHSYICQEKNEARNSDDFDTPIDVFPWIVSIRIRHSDELKHICSGVIVSDIFVLTAASCFGPFISLFSIFSIKAGVHNIYNENESTEQLRTISQIITYPNNTAKNILNDLALVRVSQSFNITSLSVSTISLSNLTSLENIDLISIGWNLMTSQSNSSILSKFPQQITVREDVQCTKNKSFNPKTQLCAVGKKYLKSILFQ
jgi:secreted trypsin-like serine protease